MNKGFVLSNFINIDSELERLLMGSTLRSLIDGALILIYNADCTEISFSKKILLTKNFYFDEKATINQLKVNAMQQVSDQLYVTFDECDGLFLTDLTLFTPSSIINEKVADFVLVSKTPITKAHIETEKHLFLSLEYMFYYIQALVVAYEKLYLMIDVYTELLLNKTSYLPHHMTNVAYWCVLLSNEFKLSSEDKDTLYFAALVYDVGILLVPDEIINKPDKLTEDEFETIKQHPIKGAQIAEASLYGIPFFKGIPTIVKHHHENYDGTGYPSGLRKEEIPLLSRILSVADSVDAMLSQRAYRPALHLSEVIEQLKKSKGTLFDPEIASTMIRILEEHKFIPAEALNDADFIPHASISFFYRNIKNVKTFTGNLIVSKQKGKFLLHEAEESISHYNIKDVHRCTLCFFQHNEFVEFSTDVYGILDDKFFLTNFVYLPSDKYFSLSWTGHTTLILDNGIVPVSYLKLGGNSVILESEVEYYKDIIEAPLGSVMLAVKEKLGELEVDVLLNLRIVKYYKTGKSYVYNCAFLDVQPNICDQILKLLFRKQIELKMSKSVPPKK